MRPTTGAVSDPIAAERLIWHAHIFPPSRPSASGRNILEIGSGDGGFTRALADMTRGRNEIVAVTATGEIANVPGVEVSRDR